MLKFWNSSFLFSSVNNFLLYFRFGGEGMLGCDCSHLEIRCTNFYCNRKTERGGTLNSLFWANTHCSFILDVSKSIGMWTFRTLIVWSIRVSIWEEQICRIWSPFALKVGLSNHLQIVALVLQMLTLAKLLLLFSGELQYD